MFERATKGMAVFGALAAMALGGSAIANATSGASTSSSSGTAATSPTASSGQQPQFRANVPTHGSAADEAAEKPVTGSAADKAKAAAMKELGGGSATEVTTDYSGNGYEVTVKKADGSTTEVHMDKAFNVRQGGPGGPGGPHGPGPGDAQAPSTPSGT